MLRRLFGLARMRVMPGEATTIASRLPAEGRILLVDDSPLVVSLLQEKLDGSGYDVTTASSGQEALEITQREGAGFDLFIVDVMMPDMDGYEVTARLRSEGKTKNASILLLTSLDQTDDVVKGLEVGADDFLNKAVSDTELVARVRSLIALGMLRQQISGQREVMQRVLNNVTQGQVDQRGHDSSRVLLVHGDEQTQSMITDALQSENINLKVEDLNRARRDIAQLKPDLVICNFDDAMSGEPAFMRRTVDAGIAVVVLESVASAERRLTSLEAGADDYLTLEMARAEITARVTSCLRRRNRLTSIEEARDKAVLAAITDPLTALYTRGFFQQALRAELSRTIRYKSPLVLILIDLDHFKTINDTHGHAAGDALLKEVGQRIQRSLRTTDIAARYGGDEFAVILTHTPQSFLVAERIRASVASTPIEIGGGKTVQVTATIGVASCAGPGQESDTLFERADAALYLAKGRGRNCVVDAGNETLGMPQPSSPSKRTNAEAIGDATVAMEKLLSAIEPGHPLRALAERVQETHRLLIDRLSRG
nr:PleD family two-component system response regulator [uncultured bacterium]